MYVDIPIEHLQINPFTAIGSDGFLITAGTADRFNTMTATWGAMGHLWGRNTVTVYVRPSRLTHELLASSEGFTISFLPPDLKHILTWCGEHSGRDWDKVKETGLKMACIDGPEGGERITFKQAALVFSCTKAAVLPLDKSAFVLPVIEEHYRDGDYHTMIIGFVDSILASQ
ncbi:MAG: flavin reductase [Sphaerochaeta sp.]|jgi:flavin reductase (DIM6/NTAB) family NADH-FMN oxidoreductase RutF|nr:flavin reductase [Sphaerochaeta sp.]MDX9915064.1 flavin reductase [Sphaerochaeta sp.]